jgi:hypothetical protein
MKLPLWLNDPWNKAYVALGIGLIGMVVWQVHVKKEKKIQESEALKTSLEKPASVSKSPKIEAFSENVSKVQSTPAYEPPTIDTNQKSASPEPPIDVYTSTDETVGDVYAPKGRLIKCRLVNTIESKNLQTPVIGIVIKDYWHNGVVVIKAGTELHGTATGLSSYDRIITAPEHTFVWRNFPEKESGWELTVKGKILNREIPESVVSKSNPEIMLTDGSAGLRGKVIENKDNALLGAIFAKALVGFGDGITDRITLNSTTGSTTSSTGSFQNAAGQSLKQAADLVSQQYLAELQRTGAYVQVTGGKTFYFYNDEAIDLSKAQIASAPKGTVKGLNTPQ